MFDWWLINVTQPLSELNIFLHYGILLVASYLIFRVALRLMTKIKLIWLGRVLLIGFIFLELINLGF